MTYPMQPLERDRDGTIRFKRNAIVSYLVEWAGTRGCSLNDLAMMRFSDDDWTQLAQLIGYSVSGAGELDYFNREVLARADREAETME